RASTRSKWARRKRQPRAAIGRAQEGGGGLAGLAVSRIDDAVATARRGAVGAAVVREDIGVGGAVVALLVVVDDAVAAHPRLDGAVGGAAVAVRLVPVVALLVPVDHAVPGARPPGPGKRGRRARGPARRRRGRPGEIWRSVRPPCSAAPCPRRGARRCRPGRARRRSLRRRPQSTRRWRSSAYRRALRGSGAQGPGSARSRGPCAPGAAERLGPRPPGRRGGAWPRGGHRS